MPVAAKLWRVSNTLGPRSQGRQAAFSGELASPPPTEPSLIEWESIYCTSHIHPCFICRWRENCPAWKVLVPTSALCRGYRNRGTVLCNLQTLATQYLGLFLSS